MLQEWTSQKVLSLNLIALLAQGNWEKFVLKIFAIIILILRRIKICEKNLSWFLNELYFQSFSAFRFFQEEKNSAELDEFLQLFNWGSECHSKHLISSNTNCDFRFKTPSALWLNEFATKEKILKNIFFYSEFKLTLKFPIFALQKVLSTSLSWYISDSRNASLVFLWSWMFCMEKKIKTLWHDFDSWQSRESVNQTKMSKKRNSNTTAKMRNVECGNF